jgi:hypothetical protein
MKFCPAPRRGKISEGSQGQGSPGGEKDQGGGERREEQAGRRGKGKEESRTQAVVVHSPGESGTGRRKYRHKFLWGSAGTAVNSVVHSCYDVPYYTTSRTMYAPTRVIIVFVYIFRKVGSKLCGAE